jgi:hypothetical protein
MNIVPEEQYLTGSVSEIWNVIEHETPMTEVF